MATTSAGERSTNRSEHSVSKKLASFRHTLNARAGVGRGCCCPVDRASTTVQRSIRETSRAAHAGFTPTCLASSSAAFNEFVPSSRLIPRAASATFPCTCDDQVCLPELITRAVRFRRSSLRTCGSSSGFRSGLRPRFFDRAFSDPLCAALRHVVRCVRVQALSPQDLTHLAGLGCTGVASSTIRSLSSGERLNPPIL